MLSFMFYTIRIVFNLDYVKFCLKSPAITGDWHDACRTSCGFCAIVKLVVVIP